ncbi:MAG: DUF2752 domain-containing protein [Flavobacteriaceae bacterium]|nr:DUF2752 domain-containing protein [Flavobacteriaceae bacterium]
MVSPEEYMLPCLNKKLLGLDCMGCGAQRALAMVFSGDFLAAFYMYPAIYTLILMFVFIVLNMVKTKQTYSKIIMILGLINGLLIVGNFIVKIFFN